MPKLSSFRSGLYTWLRLSVTVLCGIWIIFSPFYDQVLNENSAWLPAWRMFHGYGRNVCDVRFMQSLEGQADQILIDRFKTLKKTSPTRKMSQLKRMKNKRQVKKVALQLCRALGPKADLRVHARCGSHGDWKVVYAGLENICSRNSNAKKIPTKKGSR